MTLDLFQNCDVPEEVSQNNSRNNYILTQGLSIKVNAQVHPNTRY